MGLASRPRVLSRRAIELLAGAIVSALHDQGEEALLWGLVILVWCAVKPGTSLGLVRCRELYEKARADHAAALGTSNLRALAKLSSSCAELAVHGVSGGDNRPAPSDKGPAQRARRLALPPTDKEGALVASEDQIDAVGQRCILDAPGNCWYLLREDGAWGVPMKLEALKAVLLQQGVPVRAIAQGRHYRREELRPDTTCELPVVVGEVVRNTFVPTAVTPVPGLFPDITALVANVSDGDWAFAEHLYDWVSFQLQALYPQLSSRWRLARRVPRAVQTQVGIVLMGVQGSGKDTLARIIATLVGEENCAVLDQATLDSNFRGQLKDKIFIFANEVVSSTNRSDETANFMKALIAGDKLVVEAKYRAAVSVRSVANVLIASNDSNPVKIEEGDRRYSVKRSTRRLDAAVSKRIYADLDGPRLQVAAFFSFLLNRKCSFVPGQLLETQERVTMQKDSLKSEMKFVAEIKEDGWLSVSASWAGSRPEFTNNKVLTDENNIPASLLLDVYKHWCSQNGVKQRGATYLGKAMKKTFGLESTKVKDCKVYPGEALCLRPLLSVAKDPTGTASDPTKTNKGAA